MGTGRLALGSRRRGTRAFEKRARVAARMGRGGGRRTVCTACASTGSPLLRSWPSCAERATANALRTSALRNALCASCACRAGAAHASELRAGRGAQNWAQQAAARRACRGDLWQKIERPAACPAPKRAKPRVRAALGRLGSCARACGARNCGARRHGGRAARAKRPTVWAAGPQRAPAGRTRLCFREQRVVARLAGGLQLRSALRRRAARVRRSSGSVPPGAHVPVRCARRAERRAPRPPPCSQSPRPPQQAQPAWQASSARVHGPTSPQAECECRPAPAA